MKIYIQKLFLLITFSSTFWGCITNYTSSDYLMVSWENEGNIYSFDKAESITVNFIASKLSGIEPEAVFMGSKYKVKEIGKLNSNGSICRYNLIINKVLNPGEYDLAINLINGKIVESIETKVIVFPSSLSIHKDEVSGEISSNEEEVIGYLQGLTKDDLLDIYFTPSSGLNIPYNQFRIVPEGFSKSSSIIGNRVSILDSYKVPINTTKCGLKILWINPIDQNIKVQIFPSNSNLAYELSPKIKVPRLQSRGTTRISNSQEPTFEVLFDIKAPYFSNNKSGFITDVKFTLVENNLKDYKIVPLGDPYSQDETWFQRYKLQGKLPLTAPISGEIKCKVSARTVFEVDTSNTAMLSNRFPLYY
jgi:hypothetical protein